MRAGLGGDWAAARAGFDARYYRNRLGIDQIRADEPEEVRQALQAAGAEGVDWYWGSALHPDHLVLAAESWRWAARPVSIAGCPHPYPGGEVDVWTAPRSRRPRPWPAGLLALAETSGRDGDPGPAGLLAQTAKSATASIAGTEHAARAAPCVPASWLRQPYPKRGPRTWRPRRILCTRVTGLPEAADAAPILLQMVDGIERTS